MRVFTKSFSLLLLVAAVAGCVASSVPDETTPALPGAGAGGEGARDSGLEVARDGTAAAARDGGAADSDAGQAGDAAASLGEPTFATDFAAAQGLWDERMVPGARIAFGVSDNVSDNAVGELVLRGNPAFGPADNTGPRFGTEIVSKQAFSFGTYRTRVKLAACASTEDVVNGIFVFHNDGLDHNGNGLVDNTEIDIEVLCGEPTYILLSSWTDYEDATGTFRKWSRAVDTATGDILESPSDHEYGLNKVGNSPDFKYPGFPQANTFYEMGFEWRPTYIRFFIVLGGRELTLWNFTNQVLIPQHVAPFLFNVWHPGVHWYAGGPADFPARDATMRIDWLKYWAAR